MPCSQAASFMAQSETVDVLNAIKEQHLTAEQFSEITNVPLFKSRSYLRELTKLGYLDCTDDKYTVSEAGYEYMK